MISPVYVVGVGPGGCHDLAQDVQEKIHASQGIYGSERLLRGCPAESSRQFVIRSDNLDQLVQILKQRESGIHTVLATGDPNFFGIAEYLYRHLGADDVIIYPALSSVQLMCARLRMSWHDATFRSVHGRPMDEAASWVVQFDKLVVLTDPQHHAGRLAQRVVESGLGHVVMHVGENLGLPSERVRTGRASMFAGQSFDGFSVVIFEHGPTDHSVLPFGLDDEWFLRADDGMMITKRDVRAVSLAALGLRRGHVVWDIGAGTGSVAIEAATLVAPDGRVEAVERDARRAQVCRENVRRSRRTIGVWQGEAPRILSELDTPDRVFIGGSGGRLSEILTACGQRLVATGRMVVNLVSMEHIHQVLQWAKQEGWKVEVTQVSIARSAATLDLIRLAAMNPVFVVTLTPIKEQP